LYDNKLHGTVTKIVPLMAAAQPNKPTQVLPVMDYSRELNKYIYSKPSGDTAICQDKLRKWRLLGDNTSLLDLRKAYLQLHVDSDLHRFQAARYEGKIYVMTRLGFGLNVVPKIMSKVLSRVLAQDDTIYKSTDSYIDDIIVDETVVSVEVVRNHLLKFGLVTKKPEKLSNARVLGLRAREGCRGGMSCYSWQRGGELPSLESNSNVSKQELFPVCGQLTGHFPVAGWLRVACSFMKRSTQSDMWDSALSDHVQKILLDIR